uniref:amidohydrolase family protein n=1 Tax=Gemmatimonas sp. TaxID=1962908 RepID=UPI0037BFEDD3
MTLSSRRRALLAATLAGVAVATGRLAPAALTAQRAVGTTVAGKAPQGITALVGGTLIDGNGGAPLTNSVILVRGTTILAVGRVGSLAVPAGATVISTEGMHLLPGLWDMHVHLMLVGHGNYAHWDSVYPGEWGRSIMPAAARQSLMAGVTSVRDLGAPLDEVLDVKRRIARGELQGSTIYTSGPFLQHAPYPGTEKFRWGIDGVADARAKVKRLADAGVDVIKLIDQDQMTTEEIRAIVDEAHARKLPVVAHAHRPEEIRRGLAVGVDDFEHTGLQ